MASAELDPITECGGRAPSRVQGQSPGAEPLVKESGGKAP